MTWKLAISDKLVFIGALILNVAPCSAQRWSEIAKIEVTLFLDDPYSSLSNNRAGWNMAMQNGILAIL